MNPAALAIHGFEDVEQVRRHIDELADIFELFDLAGNLLTTDQWPIGRVLRGETFSSLDVAVRRTDGERSWIGSYGGTPVYDSQGRVILAILSVRDFTDRHRAEAELKAARVAAEAANVAKSQFLANMSHELRTPMNTILGMTDLALTEDLSPTVRDCLSTAKESADTLLELLNEILDLSRIEAGGFELEETDFDLREVVDQVVSMFGIRAYEKGIELLSDLGNVPYRLVGDPLRLRQVLANLLGNAVKFTHEGEIVVSAAVESREDREVVLEFSVTDTGIGIAPEDQQRILQPFSQADASTTREYGGTGLGLTISQRLVELMGGRLEIESEPGQGSTFRFTARVSLQEEPEEGARSVPDDRGALTGLRVLVVVENPTAARLLCEVFARWGMRPHTAQDVPRALAAVHDAVSAKRKFRLVLANARLPGLGGLTLANWLASDPLLAAPFILMLHRSDAREAVEAVEHEAFDVVLMDIQMPEMDGFEAARNIRRLPGTAKSRIPIIAMTAHALKGDAERCLDAGMDDYVSKPIKRNKLIEIVEGVAVWSGPTGADAGPDAENRPPEKGNGLPEKAAGPIYDLKEALRFCGEYEMFQDMAGYLVRDGRPFLEEMRTALAGRNAGEMAKAAHRLKGIVGYLGAARTTRAVSRVEKIGRARDLTGADEALAQLDEELAKLELAIQPHLRLADD